MRKSLLVLGSMLFFLGILMIPISQIVVTERAHAQTTPTTDWEFVTSRVAMSSFSVELSPNTYRMRATGGSDFSGAVDTYMDIIDSYGNRLYRINILNVITEPTEVSFEITQSGTYRFTTVGVGDLTTFTVMIYEEKPSSSDYDVPVKPFVALLPLGLADLVIGVVLLMFGLTPKRELPSKPSLPPVQ